MADSNLPASEKVLGWAVVICILIPITVLVLNKHADTLKLVFIGTAVLILCVALACAAYPFISDTLKQNAKRREFEELKARVQAMFDDKQAELERLHEVTSRPLREPAEVAEEWLGFFKRVVYTRRLIHPEFFDTKVLPLLRPIALLAFDEPRTFRPSKPLEAVNDLSWWVDESIDVDSVAEVMGRKYAEQVVELRPLATKAELFHTGGYKFIELALTQSMLAFAEALPRSGNSPFSVPAKDVVAVGKTIVEMMKPFSDEALKMWNICAPIREKYGEGKGITGVWPMEYKGDDALALYLTEPFRKLFDLPLAIQPFSEINRCAHHWCLGKPRRGKTTLLRHLIKHDLTEVAKGNCSLVVIDSKPKGLVYEMRTLKQFGPEGDLDGKLIVIDSDKPFPLNPFKMENKNLARSIITYMIATDTSSLQIGALNHFVDAVLASEDKSLETLLKYIRMEERDRPDAKDFGNFDDDLQKWWVETRPGLYARTASGVEERLANFMRVHKGAPVLRNLRADSWGLDLYKELHDGGKVLLVDTDHLRNDAVGTALMGRLFIALLENVASRRQRAPKPIWVVIDEASDYLYQSDPAFIQILIKAAGAKVGMTVAYQTKGLIDPKIEKALEVAEIHSVCEQRGRVELSIEERPLSLPVSQLEFEREDQMERKHYDAMRAKLAADYPYQTPKPKPQAEKFDPTAEAE